jgi:hypothetical protein
VNGVPARFGISAIELAAEQRTKVRQLKIFEKYEVLSHDLADSRQDAHRHRHLINGLFQMRRDLRPNFCQHASRTIVQAVQRKTSLEGLHRIGRRHD